MPETVLSAKFGSMVQFSGSIRASFTESYKIKKCLPHRTIRAPIIVGLPHIRGSPTM